MTYWVIRTSVSGIFTFFRLDTFWFMWFLYQMQWQWKLNVIIKICKSTAFTISVSNPGKIVDICTFLAVINKTAFWTMHNSHFTKLLISLVFIIVLALNGLNYLNHLHKKWFLQIWNLEKSVGIHLRMPECKLSVIRISYTIFDILQLISFHLIIFYFVYLLDVH